MFKIAIVEDERKVAEELKEYITRFQSGTGTECSVTLFSNGMDFISDYRPVYDLIIMDIKMPYLNGLNAARRLRKMDSTVCLIFITSMAKCAISGYEVGALDFIVKPVDYFNFSLKLQKALDYIKRYGDKEVFVAVDDSYNRISVRDIYYVEVMGHSLIYHLIGGKLTTHGQLSQVERELADCHFCRCNKCYLVNLNHIQKVGANTVEVGGEKLLVSRRRKKALMSALADYLGGAFGACAENPAEEQSLGAGLSESAALEAASAVERRTDCAVCAAGPCVRADMENGAGGGDD